MALQLIDGFDHQANGTDLVSGNKWTGSNLGSSIAIDATNPRIIGKSMLLQPGAGVFKNLSGALTTVVVGFGIFWTTNSAPEVFFYGSNNQVGVNVTMTVDQANGRVQVRSGGVAGTVLASSSNASVPASTWTYVELKITFNATTGSVNIQTAGAANGSATNVNTAPVSAQCSSFTLQNDATATANCWFDDHYALDTTGSAPLNNFLGDTEVETLFPTGNSSVQFTPLTGANWQMVDELAMDSDTSYNKSSTVNNTDLFTFGSLHNAPTTIFAVAAVSAIRQETASTRALQNKISSSGTTATGAAVVPGVSQYQYQQDFFTTDPHTAAAWTQGGVNALLGGYLIQA